MEFAIAAAFGLAVAVSAFLILQRNADKRQDELSTLISGVRGEERLRALEEDIHAGLARVTETVGEIDKARGTSITRLETVVREAQRTLDSLQRSTTRLADTLSNSQSRGQWGERMARDILSAAGFVENVNYRYNRQMEGSRGRPDYSFLLPEGRTLNMDVKFPMTAYMRYLDATDEAAELEAERQFLADVRGTIRGVATRDYIDPAQGTLDFMLVFIPNEHIYAFIHEKDSDLVIDALDQGVVLCSPLTLFALLSVIRQAADSFALAHAADGILQALGAFNQQWSKYSSSVDAVGRRIDSLQRAFDDLRGTRTRVLEGELATVERLRVEQHIELPPETEIEADEYDDGEQGDEPDHTRFGNQP